MIRSGIQKIVHFILSLPRLYTIAGAIVIVAFGLIGGHYLTRAAPLPDAALSLSHVHLASVASLSAQSGPLPVTGTITSLSKANILAQSSGEITFLSRSIGDYVGAGQIIGQFENSAQQAAVLQAQGAYDAAQASLAKVSGTNAQNSSIASGQASKSAQDARVSAITALQSAYGALDDAVHTKTDPLFTNPRSISPTLAPFTIPNTQLVANIQNERAGLETVLDKARTLSEQKDHTDIDSDIATMVAAAQTVRSFLNDLIDGLNQTQSNQYISASTIATDQATAVAARSEVVGVISSLTGAKTAYDAANSSAATAANSAQSGSGNDIAASEASVKSALGSLNAAKSNLEKTIIRSPISGVIVSLPVTRGDFVSNFSPVAQVSNPGALYVAVYVTSDDARTIAVGNKATIADSASGVITFIAPAIDPTNGKIEVKVGITNGAQSVTDGEVVTVGLDRPQTPSSHKKTAGITIPIVAAKITPEGPVVFRIGTSTPPDASTGVLQSHPITFGSILGDRVIILSGLTPDMEIVTDARGLAEGQTVAIDR